MLLQLGLAEDLVGVAALYGKGAETVSKEFSSIPVLPEGYVGKELVVGIDPDIVVRRGQLFANAEWGTGTVEELNDVVIPDVHSILQRLRNVRRFIYRY